MVKKITEAIRVHSHWKLVIKILPFIVVILLLRLLINYLGYEFLNLNALFTAIILANIFLVGLLISGVLADYKESEKKPSDMALSIVTMADEGLIILKNKNSLEAKIICSI